MNIIPISDESEFGLEIVLCANPETLCGGLEINDVWQKEAAADIVQQQSEAIHDIIGDMPHEAPYFRDWNGGRYYGENLGTSHVYISAYRRTKDEDGEWNGDWSHVATRPADGKRLLPADVLAMIDRITDAAFAATAKAVKEAEAAYA